MGDRTIISFDYAIKYILRDKANVGILGGFLSELLGRDVAVQEILESESNKVEADAKTNCVDLKAKIDGDEIAVFEIQYHDQIDFFGKILYGVSTAVTEQVKKGNLYNIRKVFSVNIAYHNLNAKNDYLFMAKLPGFKGIHSGEIIPFAQTVGLAPPPIPVDIHPEYYLILPKMFNENIQNKFDEWIYTLKTSTVKSDFTAKGIKEAAVKLDELKMPPDELKAYHKYLMERTSLDTALYTAIVKGEARGEARGKAEAKAEAKAEMDAKITDTVKKMDIKGMNIETIAEIAELSVEDVTKIIATKEI